MVLTAAEAGHLTHGKAALGVDHIDAGHIGIEVIQVVGHGLLREDAGRAHADHCSTVEGIHNDLGLFRAVGNGQAGQAHMAAVDPSISGQAHSGANAIGAGIGDGNGAVNLTAIHFKCTVGHINIGRGSIFLGLAGGIQLLTAGDRTAGHLQLANNNHVAAQIGGHTVFNAAAGHFHFGLGVDVNVAAVTAGVGVAAAGDGAAVHNELSCAVNKQVAACAGFTVFNGAAVDLQRTAGHANVAAQAALVRHLAALHGFNRLGIAVTDDAVIHNKLAALDVNRGAQTVGIGAVGIPLGQSRAADQLAAVHVEETAGSNINGSAAQAGGGSIGSIDLTAVEVASAVAHPNAQALGFRFAVGRDHTGLALAGIHNGQLTV